MQGGRCRPHSKLMIKQVDTQAHQQLPDLCCKLRHTQDMHFCCHQHCATLQAVM